MRAADTIVHTFVEYIPVELEERTLYVSIPYATATHLCLCGCGSEVVTPLSPTDWRLTFDGETVSIAPSIGSWSLPCRSHYWIRRNGVQWAPQWTPEEVEAGRRTNQAVKREYYGEDLRSRHPQEPGNRPVGLLRRAARWAGRWLQ